MYLYSAVYTKVYSQRLTFDKLKAFWIAPGREKLLNEAELLHWFYFNFLFDKCSEYRLTSILYLLNVYCSAWLNKRTKLLNVLQCESAMKIILFLGALSTAMSLFLNPEKQLI